jgi:excinuclease ABC subunit A
MTSANGDLSGKGFVRVRGAREHNLKNVDVDIPREALVVFTGVSGSGKSSLAFGTLYAEAQRRFLESVSPYARRLIDQAGVPDVDSIEGLPPAIALQQQRGTPSARSSVGSVTTLSSLLRLLYSRAGHYPPRQTMLYAEDFSPNTPQGACPQCHGLGHAFEVTEKSMVPDASLTIRERAIAAWPPAWQGQNQRDILVSLGYDVDLPWHKLPKKARDWILFTDETPSVPVYAGFTPKETRAALRSKVEPSYHGNFISARNYVLHTFAKSQSALMKKRVSQFMVGTVCSLCHGKRLKQESLAVTFGGYDIGALSQLPLTQLRDVLRPAAKGVRSEPALDLEKLPSRADARQAVKTRVARGDSAHAAAPDVRRTSEQSQEKTIAAQRLAQSMVDRLSTLIDLGLGYLSLDRSTPTLSPGEMQRLRLGTQLGSQLFGVIYVLDEPSAGLHPADGLALIAALERLKASGNSLFVVEHDVSIMRRADWLVDVGPAAGEQGGQILYSGPPDGLANVQASKTRPYLFEDFSPALRVPRQASGWLSLAEVCRNNLNGIQAKFPLGCFTVVTGVSGSGKSSLVSQVLLELVAAHLGSDLPTDPDEPAELTAPAEDRTSSGRIISGLQAINRLIQVDQKPIGRTPRSNLATYTGLFDSVRRLFASTPAARRRRYDSGRFSFNLPAGRCNTCEGEGSVSIELLFMPSVFAPCPTCHGSRYNPQTLEITFKEKTVAQVLAMTVDEALHFFEAEPSIARALTVLHDIGLGYLRLGQPATELSGGEAQRIKLATELQRTPRGRTLYVLDEPSTGLHPADVDCLLLQLNKLVDAGNTVVVVEHDMRIAAQADWLIDLGPGAGNAGGQVVASGSPRDVAESELSRTAPFLREALATKNNPTPKTDMIAGALP